MGGRQLARAVAQTLSPQAMHSPCKRLLSPAAFSKHKLIFTPRRRKQPCFRRELCCVTRLCPLSRWCWQRSRASPGIHISSSCWHADWQQGQRRGEGKCSGGRSSLWILGSHVERCTARILQNLHCELSTHGTQAARDGQEEAAPSLCQVRCSDTHSTHTPRV